MVKIRTINIKKMGFNEFAKKPVVDVETIDAIEGDDKTKLRPSMIGIFYKDKIKQIVLTNIENINKFKKTIIKELDKLPQPFLAFNKEFDRSVIFGFTGKSYSFREIQEFRYQKKQDAKLQYNIKVYDPFHGDGLQAVHFYQRYLRTNDKKLLNFVVQHNRACLVTEHLLYKLRYKTDKIKKPIEKTINKAFDKRLRVKIVYPSSDLRWRKIEIYEIEDDFINAFCHLRKEMRNFRISTIQDVQLTEENYKIPKDFPKLNLY
jgi:hypothetical protein